MFAKKLAVFAALTTITSFAAYAEMDPLLADTDVVINSKRIDIEAELGEKSPEEILEEARHASELRNVKVIASEIAKIKVPTKKVKEIKNNEKEKLAQKIDELFGNAKKPEAPVVQDVVKTTQAAPIKIEIPEVKTELSPKKSRKNISVTPKGGLTVINTDSEEFKSKYTAGLQIEADANEMFSFGVGFQYSEMDLTDINYETSQIVTLSDGSLAQIYHGKKLDYTHVGVDISGKFNLVTNSPITPYVGLGLGINRDVLKYHDRQTIETSGFVIGIDDVNFTYVTAQAVVGTDIDLTENLALNLEMKYSKGLSAGIDSQNYPQPEEQLRLKRIADRIEKADFATLTMGLKLSF